MANDLTQALPEDALGYVLCFEAGDGAFGPDAARACIKGFLDKNFSGRCQFFVRETVHPYFYLVGLGLKNAEGKLQPSYKWWGRFKAAVAEAAEGKIALDMTNSKMGGLDEILQTFISRGVVKFRDGVPFWVDETEDSWFIAECNEIIAREAQRM